MDKKTEKLVCTYEQGEICIYANFSFFHEIKFYYAETNRLILPYDRKLPLLKRLI